MKQAHILLPFLVVLLASRCTTKERTPIEIFNDSIRSYIEKNADDSNSYQPLETIVSDTVTFAQNLDSRINFLTQFLSAGPVSIVENTEDPSGKNYQEHLDKAKADVKAYNDEIERAIKMLDSLMASSNPNAVAAYVVKHSCSMNNKMGTLVKSDVFFEFTTSLKISHAYEQSGKPNDYPGGFPGKL